MTKDQLWNYVQDLRYGDTEAATKADQALQDWHTEYEELKRHESGESYVRRIASRQSS